MNRIIDAFSQDAEGHWKAELSCGHHIHQRHTPPFHNRPWVLDPASRAARIGTEVECIRCARGEMPALAKPYRSSPEYSEETFPKGLLKAHNLKRGSWAIIEVLSGALIYRQVGTSGERRIEAGGKQVVPPEVLHEVELLGPVRVTITFWKV